MESESTATQHGAGVRVRPLSFARAGALRYFEPSDGFAAALARALPGPLPPPGRAALHFPGDQTELVLATPRPTETLLFSRSVPLYETLQRLAADCDAGCLVDQSAGLSACAVSGARSADLLARLGGYGVMPDAGHVRTGRLADLSVACVRVRTDEVMLVVERVHAGHLHAWIRATLEDF